MAKRHETTLALAGLLAIFVGAPVMLCAILWAACRLLEGVGLLW